MRTRHCLIVSLLLCCLCQLSAEKRVLFIRGGTGTVGFFEGGRDSHAADITDERTNGGNHGWKELANLLEANGFELRQLQEGPKEDNTPIPFADLDLSKVDVIVLGSNNADYMRGGSKRHIDAIERFVWNGGGLLVISDANFGSYWSDASDSDQQFLDRFGLTINQDMGTYALKRDAGDFLVPDHPIVQGVDAFDGEGVTPVTLGPSKAGVETEVIVRAKGKVRRNDKKDGGSQDTVTEAEGALVIALAGRGRVACHFDRNTFFNLNGAGTNINRLDNSQYALNLFNWLAGER